MSQEAVPPPRVAYVILTHHKPGQARRLVQAILASSPQALVLVYHDARRSPPPDIEDPRVEIVAHSHPADWGSWEIVETTMEAFSYVQGKHDPDLVVLVSGQDYPARPLQEWERETLEVGGWVGTSWLLEYRPRWGKPYGEGNDEWTRYGYLWLRLPGGMALRDSRSRLAAWIRWSMGRVGHYFEPIVAVRVVSRGRGYHLGLRRLKDGRMKFYRGSQWVALDRLTLRKLLQAYRHDHRLLRVFRRSVIPDEGFVQTALSQGPASGPLTYVDWVVEKDAPRTLTMVDLPKILALGSPFCRKVETGLSDELMDSLDRLTSANS